MLSEPDLSATFIRFPWQTYLFGEPLKYGRYSTPQGKLFFKPGAEFKDRRVHETLIMPERKTITLRSPLLHYSWRDYQHVLEKHLKYGILGAQDKAEAGKRASLTDGRFSDPLWILCGYRKNYVFRLGFLDGQRGLLMAVILSQYAFHKYAALWTLTDW